MHTLKRGDALGCSDSVFRDCMTLDSSRMCDALTQVVSKHGLALSSLPSHDNDLSGVFPYRSEFSRYQQVITSDNWLFSNHGPELLMTRLLPYQDFLPLHIVRD
jgi:hypothetical protein